MTIYQLDRAVAALLILFGAYLIWAGRGYGFMQGTTPGAGFFPIIIGALLIVLSSANLARSILDIETLGAGMSRRDIAKFAAIVVAIIAFVMLTPPLGITIAAMLLMMAIGLIIRPSLDTRFLVRLGLISVLAPLACFAVFGTLLRVPLPRGIFGI